VVNASEKVFQPSVRTRRRKRRGVKKLTNGGSEQVRAENVAAIDMKYRREELQLKKEEAETWSGTTTVVLKKKNGH